MKVDQFIKIFLVFIVVVSIIIILLELKNKSKKQNLSDDMNVGKAWTLISIFLLILSPPISLISMAFLGIIEISVLSFHRLKHKTFQPGSFALRHGFFSYKAGEIHNIPQSWVKVYIKRIDGHPAISLILTISGLIFGYTTFFGIIYIASKYLPGFILF